MATSTTDKQATEVSLGTRLARGLWLGAGFATLWSVMVIAAYLSGGRDGFIVFRGSEIGLGALLLCFWCAYLSVGIIHALLQRRLYHAGVRALYWFLCGLLLYGSAMIVLTDGGLAWQDWEAILICATLLSVLGVASSRAFGGDPVPPDPRPPRPKSEWERAFEDRWGPE